MYMTHYLKVLLALMLSMAMFTDCSSKELPPIIGPDGEKTDPNQNSEPLDGIIANPNFEETIDLTKYTGDLSTGRWYYVGGWCDNYASVRQLDNWGYKDSRCVAIIASEHTVDVGIAQRIKVIPGKFYRVSARVKTINVSGANAESGASLAINTTFGKKSARVYGTTDWTTVTLDIEPDGEYIEIALKLGANSDDAKGEAYFDNVTISYNTSLYSCESEHIILITDKSRVTASDEVISAWLSNLDKVYEAYVELFSGRKPHDGKKITIRSGIIDAWAYAGNPIQWNEDYVAETISSVAKGDWCFGLMHELGHDFAPGHFTEFSASQAFDFNEEVFANWRMYYAIEKLNAKIINNGKTYNGSEIVSLYKSDTDNCYDKILVPRLAKEMGNALTYCLWRIKDKYGWNVWIDTWDEIYKTSRNAAEEASMTQWDKFDWLMTMLSKHTPNGEEVRETFPDGELEVIKAYLSTQK